MFSKFQSRMQTLQFVLKNRHYFGSFVAEHQRDRHALLRTSGLWYGPDVERYTGMVSAVAGDFAEIGCYKGETFSKLIAVAKRQHKTAHAFDSFEGMADPGEFDWRPKGQFAVGGPDGFRRLMSARGFQPDQYQVWDGFIPHCFHKSPADLSFSFVLLNVDNFEPTVAGLDWAWHRLNRNGILALDDFYPGHEVEASKAIKDFLRRMDNYYIVDHVNNQLILRKTSA